MNLLAERNVILLEIQRHGRSYAKSKRPWLGFLAFRTDYSAYTLDIHTYPFTDKFHSHAVNLLPCLPFSINPTRHHQNIYIWTRIHQPTIYQVLHGKQTRETTRQSLDNFMDNVICTGPLEQHMEHCQAYTLKMYIPYPWSKMARLHN